MNRWKKSAWFLLLVGCLVLILAASCSDDPVKPDKTEVDLATYTEPESEVSMVFKGSGEEKMVVLGPKSGTGLMTGLTGGTFVSPAGSMLACWFGADGLPDLVYAEGWLFRLRNYTDSTVDICGVDDNHVPLYWYNIPVDKDDLADLRDMGKDGTDDVSGWSVPKILKYTSTGISVAGCAVGAATAATGVGVALAAVTCGGAVLSVASLITDNDILGNGSTIVSAFTCGAGDVGGCASLGLDLIANNYSTIKEKASSLKKYLPW